MGQRTPLYEQHGAANARMVEFAGYDMPIQYTGIREEHMAVRQSAGLFDLSHMGEVRFRGPDAEAALGQLIANDVRRLEPGQAQYAVMCNEKGGIVDDVLVYRNVDDYVVVVNAGCRTKDVAWMREHVTGDVEVVDESDDTALVAVQGPQAIAIVQPLADVDVAGLRPFRHMHGTVAGIRMVISRTGYTGEDGVELYCASSDAPSLWNTLLRDGASHGLIPVGLGARDTLRLEAGLRLYGQDMDETVDPFSCGIGWTVKMDGRDFMGSTALRAIDPSNPPRRFIGLALSGHAIARHEYPVAIDGAPSGEVTSGTFSFSLDHGIATAYVDAHVTEHSSITVDIRGNATPATLAPLPFYRRPK